MFQFKKLHRNLLIGASVLFAAFTWWISCQNLGVTDVASEGLAIHDAFEIAKGNHRYGIVDYSHYPNGPAYLMVPLITFGITEENHLRLLPVTISAIALGILFYFVLSQSGSLAELMMIASALILMSIQPGIVKWSGALHEHAYALSMVFLVISFALIVRMNRLWFVVAGFISAWIGYDFLPATALAFLTARWMKLSTIYSFKKSVQHSFWEFVLMISGMAYAILAHIIQDIAFYSSLRRGVQEVLGAAAVRAGVGFSDNVNPDYYQWIQSRIPIKWKDPSRLALIRSYLYVFRNDVRWTSYPFEEVFVLLLTSLSLGKVWLLVRRKKRPRIEALAVIPLGVIGIFLTNFTWILLMPYHAIFHFHFAPRHLFAGTALVIVLAELLFREPSSAHHEEDEQTIRLLAVKVSIVVLPFLVLAMLFFSIVP